MGSGHDMNTHTHRYLICKKHVYIHITHCVYIYLYWQIHPRSEILGPGVYKTSIIDGVSQTF